MEDMEQGTPDTVLLYKFPSNSRPGKKHLTVYNLEDDTVECSCEGFTYNGECWHYDFVMEEVDADGGPITILDEEEG